MAMRKLTLVLDLDSGSFSTRVVDATGKLRQLDVAVNRTNATLNRANSSAQGFGSTMRQIHHSLSFVHVVMAAVTASVGGLTLSLVKVNAEAQRSVTLLEGLSKGATRSARQIEAAADFRFLKEMAKNAPFALSTLTDAFVKLKSVGVDPTQGAMQALVDGIANFGGSEEQFHRASVAIQQMLGKGVISMEELRQQLGEAFPTAIKVMARAAGMNVREFVKQVSLGKVEAEALLGTNGSFYREMEAENRGAAARMMQTFSGQVSQIQTKLREFAMAVGGFQENGSFASGSFMSELTSGARDFSSWLSDPNTIEGAKEFGRTLGALLMDLKDFVSFVVAAAPQIKIMATAFLAFQGTRMAVQGLTALASAAGLATGATGQLTKASVAARIAQTQNTLAAVAGRDAVFRQAQSVRDFARVHEASARQAIADTAAKKAQLEIERQQVLANVRAYEAQFAASRAAAYNSQANSTAGMGRLVVGAGAQSQAEVRAAAAALAAERGLKLNRAQLTAITAELTAVQAANVAATNAAAAAAARATAATTTMGLAASASRGAMTALNAVMGLMGGPIIGGLLLSIGAVTVALGYLHQMSQDYEAAQRSLESSTAALNLANLDAEMLTRRVAAAQAGLSAASVDLAEAEKTVVGETEGLSAALIIQTEQLRKNTLEVLRNARAKAQAELDNLQTERGRQAGLRAGLYSANRGLGVAYDVVTGGDQRRRQYETNWQEWMANQAIRRAEDRIKTIEEVSTSILSEQITPDGSDAASSGGGGGGGDGPGRRRESPAERLQDQIDRIGASRASLDALIDTMDEGSEAAENMRARIAEIRNDGGIISPEQEAEAIKAAADAYNLGQAYDKVKSILSTGRQNTTEAADAMALLGMSTDKVEESTEKFARQMAISRAEILRLDPALEADTARLAALDEVIRRSTADFKFTQIAQSIRAMSEEFANLEVRSIDPDLSGLDEYLEQMREFARIEAQIATITDPEQRAAAETQNFENKRRYTTRALAELTFSLDEEARANEEALMTADQARQAQFDREVDRINYLTDLRHRAAEMDMMTEEQRAAFAIQMAELRDRSIAASMARYLRDTETPMQKMVREYEDTTTQMKRLQGEWAQDLMDRLKDGESDFGEFVIKVIEDYLWMIAQAKMASVIEGGINALTSFATGMFGNMMGGSPAQTVSYGGSSGWYGWAPGASVPGNHAGGIVGKEATFFRNVSPAIFDGARRLHEGGIAGLRPGEVPTILERGEGVFTPEQMAAMGGMGSGVAIEFNLINESGQQLEASEGGRKFDGEKYIIDVIVANANRPGPLRSALRGGK